MTNCCRGTVFVATETFAAAVPEPKELLLTQGFDLRLNEEGRPLSPSDYPKYLREVDYVIAGIEPYHAEVFAAYPKLKVLSRIGIGTDAIDFAAAKQYGVYIYNTPEAPSCSVAELVAGFMLCMARGILEMTNDFRAGRWKPRQGFELSGKTLGLVGFGRTGKLVAERMAPFGMRIIACDPVWDEAAARRLGVQRVDMPTLLAQSDIVSLHVPLRSDTRHLMNSERLDSMKKGAYLINTSRGGVVDDAALIERLRSSRLAGAALDVFEREPDVTPYMNVPSLWLSPHVGSNTIEGRYRMEMGAVNNLLSYVKAREAGSEPPMGLQA